MVARSWSVRGRFLDGTIVSKDGGEDRRIYGTDVSNKAVIMGEVPATAVADVLTSVLEQYPKSRS